MLLLATDERFPTNVISGMFRIQPELSILRVQDADLLGAEDPVILAWAASEGRVLVSYDRKTMPCYAWDRVRAGQPMPGLIVIRHEMSTGGLIFELLLRANCMEPHELVNQVIYIP